jgi:hypothetical protein
LKTFIEKDPNVKVLLKDLRSLDRKRRIIENKMNRRVVKLISSRIKPVLSSHKWVIGDDFYTREDDSYKSSFSLAFRLYSDPSDVCSPGLPRIPAAKLAPNKARYKKTMMKPHPLRKINPEIKSFNDLSRVMEHWDIFSIPWNGVFISFGECSFKIFSAKGMDEVFRAAKDLGITLDMKSALSEIEDIETFLLKKKELISDLSSKMLFNI